MSVLPNEEVAPCGHWLFGPGRKAVEWESGQLARLLEILLLVTDPRLGLTCEHVFHERLAVGVDGRAVGGVADVVPDRDAGVASRERVVVVTEELRRETVRAGAAGVAGCPTVQRGDHIGGRDVVDDPSIGRGDAVVLCQGAR